MRQLLLPTVAAAALVLAGCAATPAAEEDDGRLSVVASTDVYGSIAEAVGGDLIDVTSIISGAAQDPHSYEASAQDRLALSGADLVIENGGGYDPFIGQLLEADGGEVPVLTAIEFSHALHDETHEEHEEHAEEEAHDEEGHEGHDHIEGFNEHVWYDLHTIAHLAEDIAHELGELDAANAETYTANAEDFAAELETLEERETELSAAWEGSGVAVTEPVPLYLLEASGFVNLTPDAFTEAIEEGSDVPPTALQETLAVLEGGQVVLLAYNEQTASAETERVREAAEAAGVTVLDFTETLPDGEDYLSWMSANLDRLEAALA